MKKVLLFGLILASMLVLTGCGSEVGDTSQTPKETYQKIEEDAKKGLAEDSTYGVIEAAKLFWVSNSDVEDTITLKYDSTINDFKVVSPLELKNEKLGLYGTKPTEGTITIVNGHIELTGLKFGEYTCKTENDKVICKK